MGCKVASPALNLLVLRSLGNLGSCEQKASHNCHLPYKGVKEGRCLGSGEEALDLHLVPREQAWGVGLNVHPHPPAVICQSLGRWFSLLEFQSVHLQDNLWPPTSWSTIASNFKVDELMLLERKPRSSPS